MIVSHSHKIIFIHVHRTGGSTIINLLKQQLKSKVDIISQHGNTLTSESLILEKYPDYFLFGFARNPWGRMLSWYSLINKWNHQSIEIDKLKFEEFLENDLASNKNDNSFHFNQLDYFPNVSDSINPLKIYRYEKFEEEAKKLFKRFGIQIENIPMLNNTTIKDYQKYYTKRSIELVKQKCYKDIAYFNYSF